MKLITLFLLTALAAGCAQPAQPSQPQPVQAATFTAPSTARATNALTRSASTSTPPPTVTAPAQPVSVAPDPNWDWPVSQPESQGVDAEMLAQLLEALPERAPSLHSLLVIRNGTLVSENYYFGNRADSPHVQYSITKSVISALVGIALQQGVIESVDQRIVDFFPGRSFDNMDERKAGMTLRDVLTMTSGLRWVDGDPYWEQIRSSPDWLDYMMGLPMTAAPGERFNYCSGCSHILSEILYSTTGQTPEEYANQVLFGPLGIKDVKWERDPQGISIGGWGLYLTSRQMAKIGQLYLDEGRWQGQQVVPAEWVRESTRPQVHADDITDYGYQWWYNPGLQGFAAQGADGQMIFVRPDKRLVVVFTSGSTPLSTEFDLIGEYILPGLK